MSDPSISIDEINIPEVKNLTAQFIYNYYAVDERVTPTPLNGKQLDKIPRYVLLKWTPPALSSFESNNSSQQSRVSEPTIQENIQQNHKKILSEDDSLNLKYLSHTFSNVKDITQGATDLENWSRLTGSPSESMFGMSRDIINQMITDANVSKTLKIENLLESYSKLANFPKQSLGLRIIDNNKNEVRDEEDFLSSISKTTSLRVKLHSSILPDVFEASSIKQEYSNIDKFKEAYADVIARGNQDWNGVDISPVRIDSSSKFQYLSNPVKITGYIIDRYESTPNGLVKGPTFFIEDPKISSYVDRTVLYGKTYAYSVRVIASVQILLYEEPSSRSNSTNLCTVFVSSKPISEPIECFEYVPPPPPDDIKFFFDYLKRNLIITWNVISNTQRDIKQFQILRRKSIKEPFELIKQIGFDNSDVGPEGRRYTTSERIDANNVANMSEEDKMLVLSLEEPIYTFVDEEFRVDDEFFVSSEYIYSICCVDAHGLISNYSNQYLVRFDSNKNTLNVELVCYSGSPRQYPNMNLKVDTFKDVLDFEGKDNKKIQVVFMPEYLKLKDSIDPRKTYSVVNKDDYYLLQLINVDNQKLEMLKIKIDG